MSRRWQTALITVAVMAVGVGVWFLNPGWVITVLEVATAVLVILFYVSVARYRR